MRTAAAPALIRGGGGGGDGHQHRNGEGNEYELLHDLLVAEGAEKSHGKLGVEN